MKNESNVEEVALPPQVWSCKIGAFGANFPRGADWPMRLAVQRAFKEITGVDADFCFSGWNAQLTSGELAVVLDEKK